jgi:hypothetical protein
VLAACTFVLKASCADLSLADSIEYSALRESTRAAQASLGGPAQAAGTNANPTASIVITAIDWLLVMDNPSFQGASIGAPETIRTSDLCLRRAGAAKKPTTV